MLFGHGVNFRSLLFTQRSCYSRMVRFLDVESDKRRAGRRALHGKGFAFAGRHGSGTPLPPYMHIRSFACSFGWSRELAYPVLSCPVQVARRPVAAA
jgi:hypothetical protein